MSRLSPHVVGGEVVTVGDGELPLTLQSYLEAGLVHHRGGPRHLEPLGAELEEPRGGGDAPVVVPGPAYVDEAGGGSDDPGRGEVLAASLGLRRRRVGRILVPGQFSDDRLRDRELGHLLTLRLLLLVLG